MDGYFLQECFGTIIPTRLRGGNYKKLWMENNNPHPFTRWEL
jgi:hypothetical protein